jgi:hypothetical protein
LGLVVHGVLAYRLPDLTASWAVATPIRKDRNADDMPAAWNDEEYLDVMD